MFFGAPSNSVESEIDFQLSATYERGIPGTRPHVWNRAPSMRPSKKKTAFNYETLDGTTPAKEQKGRLNIQAIALSRIDAYMHLSMVRLRQGNPFFRPLPRPVSFRSQPWLAAQIQEENRRNAARASTLQDLVVKTIKFDPKTNSTTTVKYYS